MKTYIRAAWIWIIDISYVCILSDTTIESIQKSLRMQVKTGVSTKTPPINRNKTNCFTPASIPRWRRNILFWDEYHLPHINGHWMVNSGIYFTNRPQATNIWTILQQNEIMWLKYIITGPARSPLFPQKVQLWKVNNSSEWPLPWYYHLGCTFSLYQRW